MPNLFAFMGLCFRTTIYSLVLLSTYLILDISVRVNHAARNLICIAAINYDPLQIMTNLTIVIEAHTFNIIIFFVIKLVLETTT